MRPPQRSARIDFADADLVEKVGEAIGIGRIGAIPPGMPNRAPARLGKGEQVRAGATPDLGALVAQALLLTGPPQGAIGHFLVDAVLGRRDHIGGQRQRLALAPLLRGEGSTLARGFDIRAGFGSFGEAHHRPPVRVAAAFRSLLSARTSDPARRAA